MRLIKFFGILFLLSNYIYAANEVTLINRPVTDLHKYGIQIDGANNGMDNRDNIMSNDGNDIIRKHSSIKPVEIQNKMSALTKEPVEHNKLKSKLSLILQSKIYDTVYKTYRQNFDYDGIKVEGGRIVEEITSDSSLKPNNVSGRLVTDVNSNDHTKEEILAAISKAENVARDDFKKTNKDFEIISVLVNPVYKQNKSVSTQSININKNMQQSENDKKQEIIYRVLVKAKQGNDDKNIMYKIDSQGNKLFKRNTRQEIVYKTKLSGGEASSSSSANGGDESKIDTGSGYGGNMNVGSYEYDGNDTKLEIQVIDGMCTMLNDTRHVATVNLHQDENFSNYIPYAYLPKDRSCSLSMIDEVNGGFSPLNDAHYFGGVINDMYKKYGTYALNQIEEDDSGNTTTKQAQLVMRVHYGENYENAFWDGSSMTFGDGGDNFYPLVSLDLAAHEISHGFTSQHSGLEYVNQSGALNESFSDMAGITSKAYLKSEQPEASKKVYPNMMTSEDGSLSYSAKGCRTISTNGSCVLTITYSGLNKYSGKDVIVKLPSSYTSESKCPATNGNLQTCSFVVKAIGSTKQQQSAEILLGYEDNLIKSSFILGGSVE